jgi:hypothetical protein
MPPAAASNGCSQQTRPAPKWAAPILPLPKSHNHCEEPLVPLLRVLLGVAVQRPAGPAREDGARALRGGDRRPRAKSACIIIIREAEETRSMPRAQNEDKNPSPHARDGAQGGSSARKNSVRIISVGLQKMHATRLTMETGGPKSPTEVSSSVHVVARAGVTGNGESLFMQPCHNKIGSNYLKRFETVEINASFFRGRRLPTSRLGVACPHRYSVRSRDRRRDGAPDGPRRHNVITKGYGHARRAGDQFGGFSGGVVSELLPNVAAHHSVVEAVVGTT